MSLDFICVPVSSKLFLRVNSFLSRENSVVSANETIERFIEYGLENAEWKLNEYQEDVFSVKSSNEEGYLWTYNKKKLFLPNTTKLLRKYKGEDYFAEVVGKKIIFNGKQFSSPAQLANHLSGKTQVNAWKHLYVKRPNDQHFRLAEDLGMHS